MPANTATPKTVLSWKLGEEVIVNVRRSLEVGREERTPAEGAVGRGVDREKGQGVDDGQRDRIEKEPLFADQTAPGAAYHVADGRTSPAQAKLTQITAPKYNIGPLPPGRRGCGRDRRDPMLYSPL